MRSIPSIPASPLRLSNQDFTEITKDKLVGDLLYTAALAYHAELDTMNYIVSRTMGVNAITLPSETIFATKLKVMCLWGIPRYVSSSSLGMDADCLMQVAKAKDGNNDTVKQYMLSSGMTSSALEHEVPEQLFSTPDNSVEGISTVKALAIASGQGIPIYNINQTNMGLPQIVWVNSTCKHRRGRDSSPQGGNRWRCEIALCCENHGCEPSPS